MLPLRDWGYITAAAGIAVAGAVFVHHEREIGAHKAEAQLQHERAEVAAVAASAAAESQRRETALQEIARAAQRSQAQLATKMAAAVDQRRDVDSVLDAYVRRNANSASAPGSANACAGDLGVLADVYRGADAAAEVYAGEATRRGAALDVCIKSYGALTPATRE